MPFIKNYNLYYLKIYQFIYRISQSHVESEDICQDVFLSFHDEISKGKTPDNIKAWLYKCALNRYINSKRKRKKFKFTNDLSHYDKESAHSIENEIVISERKQIIKKAISSLASQEQILINLYNDECSYKEISEIMDMKYTSVGKTLSRVIEKLAAKIKSIGHEELFEERRIV